MKVNVVKGAVKANRGVEYDNISRVILTVIRLIMAAIYTYLNLIGRYYSSDSCTAVNEPVIVTHD